jgi:hypothetical protein
MSKKNGPHVDRAVPTLRTPKRRNADKVAVTTSLSATMKASPGWVQAVSVQPALAELESHAHDIATSLATIQGLEQQLTLAKAAMLSQGRKWQTSYEHLLSTVEVYADGSVEVVKGFGLEVRSTSATLGPVAVPANLVLSTGKKTGEVKAQWSKTGHVGYVVQQATDPANPATFAAPHAWTKTKYTLGGLPSGAIVYFRVAAIDPSSSSGQSPWTAWTSGAAR